MKLEFTRTAIRDLRRMPAKDRSAIVAKLEIYAKSGKGDVKQLQGRKEYRLRHGNWRALFEISDGVIVIRVAHRSKVYK